MALKVILALVLLLAAILLFAATKPNTFQIQRSIVIDAPPERVFSLINDLHNWPRWAPQDTENPGMKRNFSGPPAGTGATSDWSGSGPAGAGRMTIIDSQSPTKVSVQADWSKPFAVRNINDFALQSSGNSTAVTWSMQGPNLFPMKLMSVFVNMDRTMGKHFEAGLANLKRTAEHTSP